jgi:hypothetical protein
MNTQEAIEILEQHQLWRRGLPPYEHGGEGLPHTPKQLGKALSHAIEHMKRGQWQPIETAPRDGSSILVIGGTQASEIGAPYKVMQPIKAYWEADTYFQKQENGGYAPQGAWHVVDTSYYSITLSGITHWMPLPDAPEVSK